MDFPFELDEFDNRAIEKFKSEKDDLRIALIIHLGKKGTEDLFNLLVWEILNDPNKNVKCAALKRIKNFKNYKSLAVHFKMLDEEGYCEGLEQYFSMALNDLGIISMDEFRNRIDI